jgi:hypothetical protein
MTRAIRQTLILIALFFAALLSYWGLQYGGVRTQAERRQRESRVLPDLADTRELAIRKLAIERRGDRLVFERRGTGFGQWQLVEPLDVAAEPTRLETLLGNLKELRPLSDAGALAQAPGFGLDPPEARVAIWGMAGTSMETSATPLATLEVGKSIHGVRYVREAGSRVVRAVDAKLLAALDEPLAEWRERVVMGVPSFQVSSVTITRRGQVIRAQRDRRGGWKLTQPLAVPADGAKVESLLAALAALRVGDGKAGFVADDVRELSKYGLEPAEVSVELLSTPPSGAERALVLHVGKTVPDRPDRVYVRQGDQDDVVMVDSKALVEIPRSALALRSQQVADIQPAAVSRIEVEMKGATFSLARDGRGWRLATPRAEKADTEAVQAFLAHIDVLQTSEFLDPQRLRNPQVYPPAIAIKIWEKDAGGPALSLRIGRYDLAKKAIYAQLEHDDVVLALPDTLLAVLPKNRFAFRERTLVSQDPAKVNKLIVSRVGRTDVLEPNAAGAPNTWRMRRPVEAPADVPAVTRALTILTSLRAEDFVSDSLGDGKSFGLDRPALEIAWETDRTNRLKIGRPSATRLSYYATLEGQPYVFTLDAETLRYLDAEFRDHVVCSFPEGRAERVVLRWPRRTVALKRRLPAKGQTTWVDEPGTDASGIDLSRASALVAAMAHLETILYFQYEGAFDAVTGLHRPRLVIEVDLGAAEPRRVLRIGWPTEHGLVFAAIGSTGSGPVFFLPAPAWEALIQSGQRFDSLPSNLFAPAR